MKTVKYFIAIILALTSTMINSQSYKALDKNNFDEKIDIKTDFYNHVNGGWLKKNDIPDDRSSWGGFSILIKKTNKDVSNILNEAIKSNKYGSETPEGKAINYYETYMDLKNRNALGVSPILKFLKRIEQIKSKEEVNEYLVEMTPFGGGGFFTLQVFQDLANSKINTAYLMATPLGLPNRDYYIESTKNAKEVREKYKKYLVKMLQFINYDKQQSQIKATQIIRIETLLAKEQLSKADSRNPQKFYNPRTKKELSKIAPNINWEEYYKHIGAQESQKIIVWDVNYTKSLVNTLKNTSLETQKTYLSWVILNSFSSMLSSEIGQVNWEFVMRDLNGAKKRKPIEERAINSLNTFMGMALGKLYVDQKFPKEAKEKAEKMIQNVLVAFGNKVDNLDWMSAETKVKAKEKIASYKLKIGYPENWKDYTELKIESVREGGTYFYNMINLMNWYIKDMFGKIGKEVDKEEWVFPPQTVNAFYNPLNNEVVLPAAILQAPYYDYKADDAVNYGGIAAVIGHEITHGFDNTGAQYDKNGNYSMWWKPEDFQKFKTLGDKLIGQYGKIEVLPGFKINGKLTLGENIADIGGVSAAYDAMQLHFKEKGRQKNIDGYTAEQRFFMSWATVWRDKTREASAKNLLKVDTHSPSYIRGFVPLQNLEIFYKAFGIKEGDKMYLKPKDRVNIW